MDNSIDDELEFNLSSFINKYDQESIETKKMVHYYSVINISNGLLSMKNKRDSLKYKKKLVEYVKQVNEGVIPNDKIESLLDFKQYLIESGRYLMYKKNFKSNTDFQRNLFFGFLLDIALYFLGFLKSVFFIPIFTILFFIIGYRQKTKAKNENRFFNQHW